MGVAVSVITEPRMAEVVRGLPQSLRLLPRFEMREETTLEQLFGLLETSSR